MPLRHEQLLKQARSGLNEIFVDPETLDSATKISCFEKIAEDCAMYINQLEENDAYLGNGGESQAEEPDGDAGSAGDPDEEW